jgi:hypothetical protein
VDSLKGAIGYVEEKGPWEILTLTPTDSIPWTAEDQLVGISATSQDFTIKQTDLPPFSLQMPFIDATRNNYGMVCAYPDLPDFNLWLTDRSDISKFFWDYPSKWRGRRINSKTDSGTMDLAIADMGVTIKAQGATQVESTDIMTFGLMLATPAAAAKVLRTPSTLVEKYFLPGPGGPRWVSQPMAAYYARFGVVEALPALSEFAKLPMSWFMTPAPTVVQFIASLQGLTLEESIRFNLAISICHNVSRYERLTTLKAPVDAEQIIRSMLNLQPTVSSI